MPPWSEAIDPVADQNEFAGVVSVHRGGQPAFARAYGLADRANEDYLAVLGGHPAKFSPGERFSYCNGGDVVLALIAERVSGIAFDQLVAGRVCGAAGTAGSTRRPPTSAPCGSRCSRGGSCRTGG